MDAGEYRSRADQMAGLMKELTDRIKTMEVECDREDAFIKKVTVYKRGVGVYREEFFGVKVDFYKGCCICAAALFEKVFNTRIFRDKVPYLKHFLYVLQF